MSVYLSCCARRCTVNLRLATHRQFLLSGKIFVDGLNLLGDVRESLVEQVEAFLLDGCKVLLCFHGAFPCFLKLIVDGSELLGYGLCAIFGSHIWCQAVKLGVESGDALFELFFDLFAIVLQTPLAQT